MAIPQVGRYEIAMSSETTVISDRFDGVLGELCQARCRGCSILESMLAQEVCQSKLEDKVREARGGGGARQESSHGLTMVMVIHPHHVGAYERGPH
jgi:hypothetical protein